MKTIIIIINMLLCTTYLFAQTNYYTATKTFYENGYTYQCDVAASRTVTLYNKSNKWINIYPKYKSTGENFVQTDAGIILLERDSQVRLKRLSIVNEAFSSSEKQRIKGHEFIITMYINSSTGRVDEVSFVFVNFAPYATIPVSVFRKIETELKKNLQFTLTEEGKKLSYIYYWWPQEPK